MTNDYLQVASQKPEKYLVLMIALPVSLGMQKGAIAEQRPLRSSSYQSGSKSLCLGHLITMYWYTEGPPIGRKASRAVKRADATNCRARCPNGLCTGKDEI